MKTRCNQKIFEFRTENSRKIAAHFNGGNISSDSGGLLLKLQILKNPHMKDGSDSVSTYAKKQLESEAVRNAG